MQFKYKDNMNPNSKIPQAVAKVLAFCKTLQNGELAGTRYMCEKIGMSVGRMHNFGSHPLLVEHRVRLISNRAYVWGNLVTIKAFKKQHSNLIVCED